jgi:hypothetical protein
MKFIVFECSGDIALNLLGTAVASSLKHAYPDREIIVVSPFSEVWLHHPDVFRVYKFGAMAYFYDDFIKDKDTIIFRHNPYLGGGYAYGKKHLIEIWCELCGVTWDGSLPSLHFTWREEEAARKLTASEEPLFMIETHGQAPHPQVPALWARDMQLSLAEKIVEGMKKAGFRPILVNLNPAATLWNAPTLNFDLRQTLCAIQFSAARLFINSYALQAAAAFNLPSAAFFISMEPEIFSYDFNRNILPDTKKATPVEEKFISIYKETYELSIESFQSPYDLEHLYDVDEIVEAVLASANQNKKSIHAKKE